jgi:hypothetical protein
MADHFRTTTEFILATIGRSAEYRSLSLVAHSDDGQTWSATPVYDSGGAYYASPAIGPSGELYVASDDFCGGLSNNSCLSTGGQIAISKSTDGGSTFNALGTNEKIIAQTSIKAVSISLNSARLQAVRARSAG